MAGPPQGPAHPQTQSSLTLEVGIPIALKTVLRVAVLALAFGGASGLSAMAEPVAKTAKAPEVAPALPLSEDAAEIVAWIIATGDNRDLPFAIVDKVAAQVVVFDAKGRRKAASPALLGSAMGDYSAEGVADRELKDIPAEDRTTPAGRFVVGFGPAAGGETVLWVDYATAISIHALPKGAPKAEKRKTRLSSKTVDDNRITHGCINVSSTFYSKTIKPIFTKAGGVFYVLPDTISVREAFPAYDAEQQLASIGATSVNSPGR